VQARNWRLMAFGCLALSAGLAGGLVWQSERGAIVPWVVQIDPHGQAQAIGPATADYQPTDPQIAWYLARFIEEVRSLPDDPIVVRQNWLRAYDFTTEQGALALNDYARANDPFSRVGKEQVAVDISSVIRASPDSLPRRLGRASLPGRQRSPAPPIGPLSSPSSFSRRRTPSGCAKIPSASTSPPSTGRRSWTNDTIARSHRRHMAAGLAAFHIDACRLREHLQATANLV
jgi:type IV secretion system protein VirB5